ncbi:MAG: NAD(P)H-hydrate dehydratase, partial [Bacteroidetes bacterium]|nr:NAD(P)H-hydrate dehydratase [Bacteroidota bacterium]
TAQQIRFLDEQTIQAQGITSVELMERAATACVQWLERVLEKNQSINIVCGTGNNGGDGLVIARQLHQQGYMTRVVLLGDQSKGSHDFQVNLRRLPSCLERIHVNKPDDYPEERVVVDALLGTGISREPSGLFAEVIERINTSARRVYSIDLPSGVPVFPDFIPHTAIQADVVLSFEVVKPTFLLPEYSSWVADFDIIRIGWDEDALERLVVTDQFVDQAMAAGYYQPRNRFDHKGSMGRVGLVAGSKSMTGAAILSAMAALRSGCGLCSVWTSGAVQPVFQCALPEAICMADAHEAHITRVELGDRMDAVGIGPGLGTHSDTIHAVRTVLEQTHLPVVIDADALNAVDVNFLLELTEKNPTGVRVLTPHPGEFNRLFGPHETRWGQIQTARKMAKELQSWIVLKGAYTFLVGPDGCGWFNGSGTPALAKGGSGDVLTGVLTSVLTKYPVKQAVILGVYLHGLAAQLVEEVSHTESVLASEVADHLPAAWNILEKPIKD